MQSSEPVFRPSKRRKQYRRRDETTSSDDRNSPSLDSGLANTQPAIAPTLPPSHDSTNASPHSPSRIPEIASLESLDTAELEARARLLKLRNKQAQQARKGGITFSADKPASTSTGQRHDRTRPGGGNITTQDGGGEESELAVLAAQVEDRFVGQTGLIVDVDKHMMAYIESELASQRGLGPTNPSQNQQPQPLPTTQVQSQDSSATTTTAALLNRPPALLGRLHEINLGPTARAENIRRTEAATLAASAPPPEPQPPAPNPRYKGRKKGKTVEDIRRDRLVEEVLGESRMLLEIYETAPGEGGAIPENGTTEDAAQADDRIAEEFRREFLEAVQQRRGRRAPAINKPKVGIASSGASGSGAGGGSGPGGAGAAGGMSRGPKLGGSRSARAAMKAAEERARKEGKKR